MGVIQPVLEIGIGWVIDYTVDTLWMLLRKLGLYPSAVEDKAAKVGKFINSTHGSNA